MERILGSKLQLQMLTDSEQSSKVLTKSPYITEKRLMGDIAAAGKTCFDQSISVIALIHAKDSIADSLTKVYGNQALLKVLRTNQLFHVVRQSVSTPPRPR